MCIHINFPCIDWEVVRRTAFLPRWLNPIIRELLVWNPDFEQIGCIRLFMFLELFSILNVFSILELTGVEPHHRDDIKTNIEASIDYLVGKNMIWDNAEIIISTWYWSWRPIHLLKLKDYHPSLNFIQNTSKNYLIDIHNCLSRHP